jgi:hypothetical protein
MLSHHAGIVDTLRQRLQFQLALLQQGSTSFLSPCQDPGLLGTPTNHAEGEKSGIECGPTL